MERFDHGGDTYGLGNVLDFSASLNPLGMPEQAIRALKASSASFSAYPDPQCRDLVAKLAEIEAVSKEWIIPTAGAGDAFTRIATAVKPKAALVCSPCYSGYEQALRPFGTRIVRHTLYSYDDFDVSHQFADAIDFETNLVVLCSPNNPTGRVVPSEVLMDVLKTAELWRATVLLDECFIDFSDAASAVDLCEKYQSLVVVKAFTKIYAMAGLRLGYCVTSNEDLANRLRMAGVPWAVSTPAQVAGIAALDAEGYVELTREYIWVERERMQEALRKLGLLVVPSHANFILFRSSLPLAAPLRDRGILIRPCGNFDGLDTRWYRVAVRLEAENSRLIAALEEVLGQ